MAEQPTINFSAIPNRRSYTCYDCNYAFYITPVTATEDNSPLPTSFRCPRCFQRHLIPHHAVVPPPPPTVPTAPVYPDDYYYYDGEEEEYEEEEGDYESEDDEGSGDEFDYYAEVVFAIPTNYHVFPFAVRSYLNRLPVVKVFENPNLSCSICMEEFGAEVGGERVVVELPCNHFFDRKCIGEWLVRSSTCPMCRIDLYLGGHNGVAERGAEVAEPAPPPSRRVNAEASGTDRRGLSANGGERSRGSGAGHDEDGDTMMEDID